MGMNHPHGKEDMTSTLTRAAATLTAAAALASPIILAPTASAAPAEPSSTTVEATLPVLADVTAVGHQGDDDKTGRPITLDATTPDPTVWVADDITRVTLDHVPDGWTDTVSGDGLVHTLSDGTHTTTITFRHPAPLTRVTATATTPDGPVTVGVPSTGGEAILPHEATAVTRLALPAGWKADGDGFAWKAVNRADPTQVVSWTFRPSRHALSELADLTAVPDVGDPVHVDASHGDVTVGVPNGATSVRFDRLPDGWTAETSTDDPLTVTLSGDGTVARVTFTPAAPSKTAVARFQAAWKRARKAADTHGVYRDTTALQQLLDEYRPLNDKPDAAAETLLTEAADRLEHAVDALEPAWWSFKGTRLTDHDGTLTLDKPFDKNPGDHATLTASDGRTIPLTRTDDKTATDPQLPFGVTRMTGRLTADTPRVDISYSYRSGKEITLDDGAKFTWNPTTERYEAEAKTVALDAADKPAADTITLSNGMTAPIVWKPAVLAADRDGARLMAADGEATLTVDGVNAHVSVKATRAYDPSLTLTLTRRDGTGHTTPIVLPGGDIKDVSTLHNGLTLTAPMLPYEAQADQYQVVAKAGNTSDVTVTSRASLAADGARTWLVTVSYRTMEGQAGRWTLTIRQPFASPTPDRSNPSAALDTILVNGRPITGWNPDVRDYTIRAGEHEKVTVSPRGRAGLKIVAGDARQTAYTTIQSWTVTAPDGQQRVYTVTLVRDHATPTADEAFTPPTARDMGGTTDAPTPATARVASVGYVKDGRYTRVDADRFDIPQGAGFAYESYKGQTVRVTQARLRGMTWRYTLGVLAPDGQSWRESSVEVTFRTAATMKAELSGISVDGTPIRGFDPARTAYTVQVADPSRYVVTAQWDKQSGMSVVNHKDGRTVTLTVTSADLEHTRVYTVTVEQLGMLAATGVRMGVLVGGVILLAAAGLGGRFLLRRRHDDGKEEKA